MLILPRNDSHWYGQDGSPCYEVEAKSGNMRKTTLADARKMSLVPSVTTILSIINKPGLDAWKSEQLLLASATTPRNGLPDDQWVKAVMRSADELSRNARTLGSDVHYAIETWLVGGEMPSDPFLRESVLAVQQWLEGFDAEVYAVEKSFCCEALGYGGKVDLVLRSKYDRESYSVIDFKTQGTKPGQKIRTYDEYGMQLAAYARGLALPDAKLWNIIISTTEPGRLEAYDWDNNTELDNAFNNALNLWKFKNKYDPKQEQGQEQ